MNHRVLLFLALLLPAVLSACESQPSEGGKHLASVNGCVITENDYRQALKSSAYLRDLVGITDKDKVRILNEQIRKEVLIQAAIELGLDKDEDFRLALERYWEQTLISSLLKRQCALIEGDILVSREELETRYHSMEQEGVEMPPIEEALPNLEAEIREEKKTKALEAWMDELFKKAQIMVNEQNLSNIKF